VGTKHVSSHGTSWLAWDGSADPAALPHRAQGVHITLRMRLMCEVWRAGRDAPEQAYEVMNEVVVDRGANPYLTKIECWEHGRLITKARRCYQAQRVMRVAVGEPRKSSCRRERWRLLAGCNRLG